MQALTDEFDRHLDVVREDLTKEGSRGPQMIDDNDCRTEIDGPTAKQAYVSIQPTGGATDAH